AEDVDFQSQVFQPIREGLARRGTPDNALLRSWGEELAQRLFVEAKQTARGWQTMPLPGKSGSAVPWYYQEREIAGQKSVSFFTSHGGGEQSTGIMRSPTFEVPTQLSFYLAGHRGPLDQPSQDNTRVRLRAAEGDAILAEALTPRNDTPQRIEWDL